MKKIEIYDTTLRDGAQSEDISFSVEDKLRIARKLDHIGIAFIEGGWPGSNPKDLLFFEAIKKAPPRASRIVAFGATRKAENKVSADPNIRALLDAGTSVVTLFGKSWNLHVSDVLGITLAKNLQLISDSILYLKSHRREVFYDAEHFFDGFLSQPDYAMKTLQQAKQAGADRIVLCDTNGGMMPWQVEKILQTVLKEVDGKMLGIHTHNDSEMAVVNALTAVRMGVTQVQGTINGHGERCGNANLCSVIANLELKMGFSSLPKGRLADLQDISKAVSEIANLPHNKHLPYVGDAAFAHKGGIHVQAVRKNSETYEHVSPSMLGNRQRILISDYSGRSNILAKAKEYGVPMTADHPHLTTILKELKEREHEGFQYEGADGSFELMIRKQIEGHKPFFNLIGFHVRVEKQADNKEPLSEATVRVEVGGQIEHSAAIGNGPVSALDLALRRSLEKFYPILSTVKLIDYKVRVLNAGNGTGSKVRVFIESGDGERQWGTVGVSENIIEASWQALIDSIEYKLLNGRQKKKPVDKA